MIMNNKYYIFIVKKNQKPLRIDKFLIEKLYKKKKNRKEIQKILNTEKIYINNYIIKKNYIAKPLDKIKIIINSSEEFFLKKKSLNLIYEDDDLIIINKQSGLLVYPVNKTNKVTLLHAIKFHLNKIGINANTVRMGLIHRLDKESSGLMIIAKHDFVLQYLAYQFFTHSVYRRYIALVWGNLEGYETIKVSIGKNITKKKYIKIYDHFGKHSVTHYKVLEKFNIATLVSCRIDTGRTHQIRAHFLHLGYPIFNDVLYGQGNIKQKKIVKNYFFYLRGQFLHAQSLIFIHPITGNPIYIDIPLPKEMFKVLKKLREI